jgi:hypothetical protein
MQLGVLIREGEVIVGKIAYAGDLESARTFIEQWRLREPSKSFEVFDDDQDPAFVAAVVPYDHGTARTDAVSRFVNDPSPDTKLLRAILLAILDEVNVIRGLLVPAQAPRTAAQFRTAVQNKLTSGAAD